MKVQEELFRSSVHGYTHTNLNLLIVALNKYCKCIVHIVLQFFLVNKEIINSLLTTNLLIYITCI